MYYILCAFRLFLMMNTCKKKAEIIKGYTDLIYYKYGRID